MAKVDVLSVSDMCVDLVLTGDVQPRFGQVEQLIDDYLLELGGSANIFASQFVKLGGRAGVIGRVGSDPLGRFVMERLKTLEIDLSHVLLQEGLKTGLGVALAKPDDRGILTYLGSIDSVVPEDLLPELLESCNHWHLASYFLLSSLRKCWKDWLNLCKERGVTVSIDTNWDPANDWSDVKELLSLVDVFLPNEAEALAISGKGDIESAGKWLGDRCPLVVVKQGGNGASAFENGIHHHVRSIDFAPEDIVDAIGAGDSFDAGFLRGWLLGWDLESSLQLATDCGGASLGSPGGFLGQLVREVQR